MRFTLSFELPSFEFPSDHARLIISFLKKSIKAYDEVAFQRLFGESHHQPKSYSFSLYLPGVTFKRELSELKEKCFEMTFSSNSLADSLLFYNAFLNQKNQPFHSRGNYQFTLKKLSVHREVKIEENQCLIKFLSPLLVMEQEAETGFKHCFELNDANFDQQLKGVIQYQINTLAPHLSLEQFSLTPLQTKRVMTQAYGCYLPAYTGVFELTGNPELIQFLYDGGIGNSRGAGYGLFELI